MTATIRVDPNAPDLEALRPVADVLLAGGVAVVPTETVYGLCALPSRPAAVERLGKLKDRPPEKPFTLLLASRGELETLVQDPPPAALRLMDRYWPGPLTIVLPRYPGASETVGVRVPAHAVTRAILELVGAPLLAPSANPAGQPPATTAEEARNYFAGSVETIVDAGPAQLKEPSTVIRVGAKGIEFLRVGLITPEMAHQLLAGRRVLFVCTGNTCRSPMAAALFRKHLSRRLGKPPEDLEELGYRIESAGTFACRGSRASEHAIEVMKELDCDLSGHRAQPLEADIVRRVDRVYAMTPWHRDRVLALLDSAGSDRVSLLRDEPIPDPAGGDVETYRDCARAIDEAVARIVAEIG